MMDTQVPPAYDESAQPGLGQVKIYPQTTQGEVGDTKTAQAIRAFLAGAIPQSEWEADESREACKHCNNSFGLLRRRHHCRKCGCVTCGACSRNTFTFTNLKDTPERICDYCHAEAMTLLQDVASVSDTTGQKLVAVEEKRAHAIAELEAVRAQTIAALDAKMALLTQRMDLKVARVQTEVRDVDTTQRDLRYGLEQYKVLEQERLDEMRQKSANLRAKMEARDAQNAQHAN